jgi:tetratricopeptide (TPR) repeat protein
MRAAVFSALLLLVSLLGSAAAPAADSIPASPRTTFFHANALYKDGQYEAAAKEYEDVLRSGVHSGNLYFNLGNAYFKAGETGKAILNYERARRLMPADPDLRANLAYAQSLTDATDCAPGTWRRVLFPLAHRSATSGLVWLAGGSHALLFAALTVYQLWPRRPRWLLHASVALAALVLITAASLGEQVYNDDWQQAAVVLPGGDTPARFEPAPSGTVHFVLKQGSLVRVTDTRDGWLQITRCDGRRGWIERGAVEDL